MTKTRHSVALRCGGALGFLGMALVGWNLAEGRRESPAASSVESRGSSRSPQAARTPRAEMASEAKRRMAAIRAAATPEERLRATIALAQGLPVSQIAVWMEQRLFERGGGFELTMFNRILTERWKKEDPGGLAAWYGKNNPSAASRVIADWAATEPQQVLEFLRGQTDPAFTIQALRGLASSNPSLALKGFAELAEEGGSSSDKYYRANLLEQFAKVSPDELEGMLESLPAGIRSQAEAALSKQRLATSFSTEFAKLLNQSGGLKVFQDALQSDKTIGEKLLENLATLPAHWRHDLALNPYYLVNSQPEKWLAVDLVNSGFTEEDAKRIRDNALVKLSSAHPERALHWMDQLGMTGEARSAALETLFQSLDRAGDKGAALLAALTSPGDREIAERVMARAQNVQPTVERKQPSPADWLQQVAAMKPHEGNSYQLLNDVSRWDSTKVSELVQQFDSLPAEQKTAASLHLAHSSAGPLVQRKAIEHLLSSPDPTPQARQKSQAIESASEHAVRWLQTDPDAASRWVSGLPSGDARQWVQKNLAANWAKYDFEQAERWIKSLPASDRSAVESHIKRNAAP